MGISEGGEGGGIGVDCSVGTIVWVRRRNGSWWPGRILGPDELSASHLMSPRSGTPVKLLGREDASVDWYNLEKSKRVKAFRCGEFDACIERAEAAQGIPIKKREKYARREDAILHALELEKKQLEMKQRKSGVRSNSVVNKPSGTMEKEIDNLSSETHIKNDEPGVHGKHTNDEPQMLSRKAGLSHEEENIGNLISEQKGQNDNKFGFEEDIPENVPRMRGLQDFGLRIAPSKRKPSQSVDNHMDISNAGHAVGVVSHGGSSKNSLPNKKKRSQGGMMEESLVKKRDRRRPLNQVLQSSPKLPPPHSFQSDHDHVVVSMNGEKDYMGGTQRTRRSRCTYLPTDSNDSLDHGGYPSEQMPATQFGRDNSLQCPGTSTDEYTSSGLMEVDDSDFSGKVYLETDVDEEANLLRDTKEPSVVGAKGCELSANQVSEKFTNLENTEVPLSSSVHESHPQEHTADVSAEIGVSRWHMKGKRNTRNITKRPIDVMDGKVSVSDKRSGSVRGAAYETKGSSLRRTRTEASSQRTSGRGFYHNKAFNYGHEEVDLIGKDLGHVELTGYSNRRYSSVLKAARDRGKRDVSFKGSGNNSSMISPSVWKSGDPSHAGRRAYREDSDEFYEPAFAARLGGKRRPMLFDVDLKVQASYQGEHVPLVSLMSRLNGKAIIGHPVQIEILEDGSTDALVSRNVSGLDKSTACPTSWRTGRRTAMQRVPRSNPSTLDGEDAGGLRYTDRESKPLLKKYSGHLDQQVKLSKKSASQAHQPASGNSQKKSSRKVIVSAQKTRTLSSIGTEPRLSGVNRGAKPVRGGSILGGLIKPGGTVPLVTCVPVKVAYSRICEAVGRP